MSRKHDGTMVGVWMTDEELQALDRQVEYMKPINKKSSRSDVIRLMVKHVSVIDLLIEIATKEKFDN